MKKITIVIAESGKFNDREILPGTTAQDVLKAIGLPEGYVLSSGKGQEPFGKDEVIYDAVADGAKVYASTPVEVGSGPLFTQSSFFSGVASTLGEIVSLFFSGFNDLCNSNANSSAKDSGKHSSPRCFKIVTKSSNAARKTGVKVVERTELPYWQQRGWKKKHGQYSGYFRTKYGSFLGKATVSASRRMEMFIKDPPECLSKHSHWPCFMLRERGWYFIHNNRAGNFDLSSGLLDVENILTEAYKL